jgi:hypothetical protein
MNADHRQGLLDTNILVLRRWIEPRELPDEMAISAITLAGGSILPGGNTLQRGSPVRAAANQVRGVAAAFPT